MRLQCSRNVSLLEPGGRHGRLTGNRRGGGSGALCMPAGRAGRERRAGTSVGVCLGVIVRVLRARVNVARVSAFNAVFRRQVALLRQQPGLVYVKLARRLQPDGGEEAILFEEWQDAASLYAWVGPNLTEPRLVPGARELIEELIVAHYEALAEEDQESFAIPPSAGIRA